MKLVISVDCPDLPFTCKISNDVTDRLLLTSPIKNPSEADAPTPVPFIFASATVTRLLFGIPVMVTVISLPENAVAAAPTVADEASVTDTVPADVIGPVNWNTSE